MKLQMRVSWPAGEHCYDIDPKHYGTDDREQMVNIDLENFKEDPLSLLEPLLDNGDIEFSFEIVETD